MRNNKSLLKLYTTIFALFASFTRIYAQKTPGITSDQPAPDALPDPCRDSMFTDCTKCPCPAFPVPFNAWMLAITGLSATLSFVFFICLLLVQKLREKPGNLAFQSILAQAIFSISFLVEKIEFNKTINGIVEQAEADAACEIFGIVKVSSVTLINFYMLSFFGTYILSLKNYLKINRVRSRHIHLVAFLAIVLINVVLFSWGAIGPNPDGTCGIISTPALLAPVGGYGIMTIIGLYLIHLLRKNLYERETLNPFQRDFVKHYMFFLILLSILFFINTFISVFSNIRTSSAAADIDRVHILSLIQFILLNLTTPILIISRLSDPLISEYIKSDIKRCFCWWSQEHDQGREEQLRERDLYNRLTQDEFKLDIHKSLISNDRLIQSNQKASEYPDREFFERNKKTDMMSSMLVSLACFWKMNSQDSLNKDSEEEKDECEEILRGGASSKQNLKKISIQNSLIKRMIPQVTREMKRKNKKLLTGMFTAYGTEMFKEMIERESLSSELKDSWNFVSNYGNINCYGYQVDEYDKMFFLSSNGKYILQEISLQERRNLIQVLPRYADFLKENPNSLLAKIYGIFCFEVDNLSRQINMIVIRNKGEGSWPAIERLYKIRGPYSSIETKKNTHSLNHCAPLDEKDFAAYEGKLMLNSLLKTSFMGVIEKDITFLAQYQMENYALQITIVDQEKVSKEVVSNSIIIEVEESIDSPGGMKYFRDPDLILHSSQELIEPCDIDEDLANIHEVQNKTHASIVDFWRERKGGRKNFVWQTLRSMKNPKPEDSKQIPDRQQAFLSYIESILA